jgi:hypothetical protein
MDEFILRGSARLPQAMRARHVGHPCIAIPVVIGRFLIAPAFGRAGDSGG